MTHSARPTRPGPRRRLPAVLLAAALLAAAPLRAQEAPVYVVRAGDTLYGIARTHGLTVARLQQLNDLDGTVVRVGQRLVVGTAAPADPAPRPTAAEARALAPGRTVVQPGDTYYTVGARLGVAADTLWALNGRRTDPLAAGAVLAVPPDAAGTAAYVVRDGDTLYGIARAHGTTVAALRELNALPQDRLAVGQRLAVPAAADATAGADAWPVAARGAVTVYPATFAGRLMADGRPYDPERFVVSHASLPLGTVVLLTHAATGRRTFAEVADRGPLDPALLMDVSAAVARALGGGEAADVVTLRVVR